MYFAKKLNFASQASMLLFINHFLLSACSTTNIEPTPKELQQLSNPPEKILTKIEALIPIAIKWYEGVEAALYQKGRVLSKAEKKQAKLLGIKNPDVIRVVVLDKFPEPNKQTANNHLEGARAMGNLILIKPKHKNNSVILCHELVHIAQVDRLGLKQFLMRYAVEHEVLGYDRSLLENEAYNKQQVIQ